MGMLRTVRHSPTADVLKILLYMVCTMTLGSMMAPWVYNAGKGISETTEHKSTNGVIEWIADAAERWEFSNYFKLSLMIAAALLLIPLFSRWGLGPLARDQRIAAGSPCLSLWKNQRGITLLLIGLSASALTAILGAKLLLVAGWLVWKPELIFWTKILKHAALTATLMAVVEEWIFRGWLFGIFLRAMRPQYAITLLALISAFIHLLQPQMTLKDFDPEALDAGLIFLKQILATWLNPETIIRSFSVILAACVLLTLARYRTSSLWLSIGLHAGWLIGFQMLSAITLPDKSLPLNHWLLGPDLREGLVPLAWILASGWIALKLSPRMSSHEAA